MNYRLIMGQYDCTDWKKSLLVVVHPSLDDINNILVRLGIFCICTIMIST